ncbi:MAG: hypothetical protein KFH87_04350, partial [Bacteroidetes bacterium]|nr:hypothetical protein [Bacteroidota bacterium]
PRGSAEDLAAQHARGSAARTGQRSTHGAAQHARGSADLDNTASFRIVFHAFSPYFIRMCNRFRVSGVYLCWTPDPDGMQPMLA